MQKTSKFFLLISINFLLITVYSCRKGISDIFDEPIADNALWAKNYYREKLLTNGGNLVDVTAYSKNTRLMSLKSASQVNKKIPIWEKATVSATHLYSFVEVPIKYTQKITPILYVNKDKGTNPVQPDDIVLKSSLTKLIIYKNKKGKINQRLVSFIPSKAYVNKHNGDISHNRINKLDKDFDGYLIYREWDGTYLFSLVIKNGKAAGRISFKKGDHYNFKPVLYKKERVCVTIELYEWFQYCYYYGDDPNPFYCEEPYREYVDTLEVCWDDGYGDDPCTDPANFNTGMCDGEDEEYEFQPEPRDSLVKDFCDGLTPQQKTTINNMLAELKNYDCASKYIYNKFDAAKTSFNFCIGGGSGNATYNPADKSFNFTTDYTASRTDIMEHELFHAYQDDQYAGGTQQYARVNGVAQPGFVNIEFEQALMADIIHGGNEAFGVYGGSTQQNDYENWINDITANGTYPKFNPNGTPAEQTAYNTFINQYNNFLDQFNALSGNPYSSTKLSMAPQALINLFNNINPNCQ